MLGSRVCWFVDWILLEVSVAFQKGFPCSSGRFQMPNQMCHRIHAALPSCQDPVIRWSNRLDRGFWVPKPRYRGLIAVLFPWGKRTATCPRGDWAAGCTWRRDDEGPRLPVGGLPSIPEGYPVCLRSIVWMAACTWKVAVATMNGHLRHALASQDHWDKMGEGGGEKTGHRCLGRHSSLGEAR